MTKYGGGGGISCAVRVVNCKETGQGAKDFRPYGLRGLVRSSKAGVGHAPLRAMGLSLVPMIPAGVLPLCWLERFHEF